MPLREITRLRAVDRFLSIQFENEKEVRDLVRLAAEISGAKSASITILDTVTQSFQYNWGIEVDALLREEAFRSFSVNGKQPVVIPDVRLDANLANNPFVQESPFIRFYAGVPLLTHDGQNVGSLCVLDNETIPFSDAQLSMLGIIAKQIVQLFELQASILLLKEKLADVRTSQIRLRSFFNSRLVLHLLLDTDFKILSFNAVFSALVTDNCAVQPKEGDDIKLYLQPHSGADFLLNYKKALLGEQRVSKIDTKNEKENLNWIVYFEPAFDPENRIIGVSCNALDITQKVKQEAQLTRQNEHLRQVAFYQSHDLRRPVSSILGIVDYLCEKFGDSIPEEMQMLRMSTLELDEKIKNIVHLTDNHKAPDAEKTD